MALSMRRYSSRGVVKAVVDSSLRMFLSRMRTRGNSPSRIRAMVDVSTTPRPYALRIIEAMRDASGPAGSSSIIESTTMGCIRYMGTKRASRVSRMARTVRESGCMGMSKGAISWL